jgi:DNA processing protein
MAAEVLGPAGRELLGHGGDPAPSARAESSLTTAGGAAGALFEACTNLLRPPRLSARERAEQRQTCLWLAEVAALREGAIGRLCRRFGGMASLVTQPRETIAAELVRLSRRSRVAQPAPSDHADWEPQEAASRGEGAAWEALLADPGHGARATGSGLVVTYVDELYPQRLRRLYDPPPAIYVAGASAADALGALSTGQLVGIVGARSPSPYGREMAAALAADLARAGVVVVSGLALGIDASAQECAIRAARHERPATVGVLGCGIDVVYPRGNARLFATVLARGLIISEFYWGLPARRWRFPARNRVIAGLCDALVVVEGSTRSGALTTAGFMNDINGNVLAVPGEAGRRLSAGPHKMLRECYAAICESADDVLMLLSRTASGAPVSDGAAPTAAASAPSEAAELVLDLLDAAELSLNEVAAAAGLALPAAAALLAGLELDGLIRLRTGGRYGLVRGSRRRGAS